MIQGGCLCGGQRFEVERVVGPFELCHCPRCRKASGTAFAAMVGVRARDFRWRARETRVRSFALPVRERPPGYSVAFCERCGSPVPDPPAGAEWFELPAGLLDADPGLRPERHIYVERPAPWFGLSDGLPRLTREEVAALRRGR